jgi:hypothetical protein
MSRRGMPMSCVQTAEEAFADALRVPLPSHSIRVVALADEAASGVLTSSMQISCSGVAVVFVCRSGGHIPCRVRIMDSGGQ